MENKKYKKQIKSKEQERLEKILSKMKSEGATFEELCEFAWNYCYIWQYSSTSK